MSMDPELRELMVQTVRISKAGDYGDYGHASYEPAIEVACHINSSAKERRTESGSLVLSTGTAFLAEIVPWFTAKDKMEVPELSTESGWRVVDVIGVQTRYDEDGPHHQEAYFGELT